MGKKSENRKQRQEKKQLLEKIQNASLIRRPNLFDDSVALNPSLKDIGDDNVFFSLSFATYNDRECGARNLQSSEIKNMIQRFKELTNKGRLSDVTIIKDRVPRQENYECLFNGLSDDIDFLFETELSQKARVFFYLIEKVFYVVVIKDSHIKIDKPN